MSGTTTVLRGFTLSIALALAACAMAPREQITSQSLVDHMLMGQPATAASCAAAGMALYCASNTLGRVRNSVTDNTCGCADRSELRVGGMPRR